MPRIVKYAYWISLHLLLVLVLWKSNFLQKVGYRFGIVTPWEHHTRMMTYHRWMDPVVPDGSVIFIGDSITQGLPVSAIVPNGINYGIGGDTTVGVLQRLPQYDSLARAEAIFLLIGINDMKWRSNEAIAETYRGILAAIPEGPSVFIASVLPVNEGKGGIGFEGSIPRITDLNLQLKRIAAEKKSVAFVDLFKPMASPKGHLRAEFDLGDGLHLSPEGYRFMVTQIKNALSRGRVVEVKSI